MRVLDQSLGQIHGSLSGSTLMIGILALMCAIPPGVRASQNQPFLRGFVITQQDSKPIAGVAVELLDPAGKKIREALTSRDGTFTMAECPAGFFQVRLSASGFREHLETIELSAGRPVMLNIALKIKGASETVEVLDRRSEQGIDATAPATPISARVVDLEPVKGDNYQALLPLVPGVVRGPDGRINIKGASAIQSALLVSSSSASDPSTGNPGFELPSDAIESVQVLPNPYQAEYGRFSSGMTRIDTRKGESRWGYLLNNFLPRQKWRDGSIMGIGHFTPRLSISGPLVRKRAFLAQSFQYRIIKTAVHSQPVLARDQSLESFDSFSRFDVTVSKRHALVIILAIFPRKLDYFTLNTFNPKNVTANLHNRGVHGGFQETTILGSTAVLETAMSYRRYDSDIFGQGTQPMEIHPRGNRGNFFNWQARRTNTFQWTENFSKLFLVGRSRHLVRGGIDLVRSGFTGSSRSAPVDIYRAAGTLHTRIEYSGPSGQEIRISNIGAYLQDHWRMGDRWGLELGLRLERDSVPSRWNLSPRTGLVFSVLPEGRGVLRGGAGLFHDQTPMNVGVFESYERRTIKGFAMDGVTPVGSPTLTRYRSGAELRSPFGFIWNVEYDQRLSGRWLARANYLRRRGQHEYLIDPLPWAAGTEYVLESRGRSRYWEVECTLRYARGENFFMIWSYVRSESKADLNGYDLFFGNLRNPVIQPNEYSRSSIDAPHRLVQRAALPLPSKITFSTMVEVRTGFPYSAVTEGQQFVGSRNRAGRFPTLATLDVRAVRPFKYKKWIVELGGRVYHLLNSFAPRDVQSNVDAPDFATFYNTIPRNWGFTLQFKK